jgi:cytidine deaminase
MDKKALFEAAKGAKQEAYAPYSSFRVGAALLDKNGVVHTGCNVENASYPAGCCAERVALFSAVAKGVRQFEALCITGDSSVVMWPCGICRQALYEFAPDLKIIATNREGKAEEAALSDLLPNGFGRDSL